MDPLYEMEFFMWHVSKRGTLTRWWWRKSYLFSRLSQRLHILNMMELCDYIFYKLKLLSWPCTCQITQCRIQTLREGGRGGEGGTRVPGPLPWIRHFNESDLTDFSTCTEGKSRGSLYMTLAALQLSLPQRPLCVAGKLGERKRKRGARCIAIFSGALAREARQRSTMGKKMK